MAKKTKQAKSRWAEHVKEVRYRDFTIEELREMRDLWQGFLGSLQAKIDAMEALGMDSLSSVYGATKPAKIESEVRNFLGNLGRAMEKQERKK